MKKYLLFTIFLLLFYIPAFGAAIDSHNFEAPYDGDTNLDGYDGKAGTPSYATTNLPKDVGSSKCDTGSRCASFDALGDYLHEAFSNQADIYGTFLFKLSALPPENTNQVELAHFLNDTSSYFKVFVYNNAGTSNVRIQDTVNFNGVISTVSLSADTWYQVRLYILCGTSSDGSMKIRVRNVTQEWADTEAEQSVSGQSYGTTILDQHRTGINWLSGWTGTEYIDWFYTDDSAYPSDPPPPSTGAQQVIIIN